MRWEAAKPPPTSSVVCPHEGRDGLLDEDSGRVRSLTPGIAYGVIATVVAT
jgi:hypothetical protein